MEKNKRTLQSDEYFCSSCGEMIKKAAEICPKCGVRMKSKESSKSKTIAVLLAFFLGMWTWVYTWKTDQYKFATVCFLGVIAWIAAVGGSFEMLIFLSLGTWAWALISTLIRPDSFYQNYNEVN